MIMIPTYNDTYILWYIYYDLNFNDDLVIFKFLFIFLHYKQKRLIKSLSSFRAYTLKTSKILKSYLFKKGNFK